MIKRIDTIKRLRRSVPQQKVALKRDLKRAKLTENDAYNLVNRIENLSKDEDNLKLYETWYATEGDAWAKDDWPHALMRGLARTDQLIF